MLAARSKRSVIWKWNLKCAPTPAGARSRFLQPLLPKHPSTNKIEMKPIEDADIERNWAEHFPKRLDNGHSKTVCAYICLIRPTDKAQHETAERWSKKLRLV